MLDVESNLDLVVGQLEIRRIWDRGVCTIEVQKCTNKEMEKQFDLMLQLTPNTSNNFQSQLKYITPNPKQTQVQQIQLKQARIQQLIDYIQIYKKSIQKHKVIKKSMSDQQNLEQYRSNLSLIKSMTGDKAEEQFYQLMEKAKNSFGQLSLYMAEFYFQYAKFLLEKMEKNIDIFNAGSLPVGEPAAVAENPIPEDMYEDDSSLQSNSQEQPPKSQNNAVHNKPSQQNPTDPVITQNEQSANKNGHKDPVPQNQNENQVNENQGQDDDYEICAQNLLCAIKIFQNQRDRIKEGGEQGIYSISEVARWISRCKSRLGDLHHLSQNYVEAVNVYREVVEDQEKKFGHESNRGLAQIHYMIANSFLYQNKDGCQRVAIKQFLKSVQILKNHLMMLSPDDNTIYQTPTQQKIKVDRFAYLPRPTDTEQIKQIKEVISCLLDKIQDTHEQISIRAQYEAEKKKTKEEEEQNQFKEVSPNTNVVKLGTFGNRKKKADELPDEELKKKNG